MTATWRGRTLGAALALAVAGIAVAAGEVAAQPGADVAARVDARAAAADAHLWRVGVWGTANALGGLALWRLADGEARRAFGLQSGVWGVVNLGIATVGLVAGGDGGAGTWAAAVDAERGYHDILLFNMGLNVAYAAVGGALVAAGYRDVRSAASWRGHGAALILQGAALLVLDGVALAGSRSRLADLLSVPGADVGLAAPAAVRLVVIL